MNTVKLVFQGHSDDIFGEVNHFNIDYDTCATDMKVAFLIESGNDSLMVIGEYGILNTACWHITVINYDPDCTDKPFPNWEIKILPHDYQSKVVIYAPEDVTIQRVEV